jgi:protein O-mannosyl-transferase
MWTTFHMGHWIPLTWMTFGLDYLLWGLKPVGYHLTNLLLHAANAAVFYFVARRLLGLALPDTLDRGQAGLALSAGFAALLFALHPLRVESVAWATERRDVLAALFYLLTILMYLRARERAERGGWPYWAALGLFACALLSKSMAVSLPVALLILDVYPLRRVGRPIGWWSAPAWLVYVEKIPFVLLAAAASAMAFAAQSSVAAAVPLTHLSVVGRLAVSAYGLAFYLGRMVAPVDLSPLYELPLAVNPWAPPFLLSYGLVVAITTIVLALRRRVPGLLAAWVGYVVILLPVLGIFQNGPQIAADRYTYLAGLGWTIFAAAGLLSRWHAWHFPLTGLAVGVLLGLGILTWNQVQVWRDSEKLWAHALAVDPQSSSAEHNLGWALADQGKLAEAIDHYRHALQIKPNYAQVNYRWGIALARQGKLAEAIEHYQQALRLKPDYADAHNNWGNALARQGKLVEAIQHYQQVLHVRPDYALAHYNWGVVLAQQGKLAEAIEHYQQALRFKPDYADAHFNWGLALIQQGQPADAVEHYRQALRLKPDHAAAQSNLLDALQGRGTGKEDVAPSRKGEKAE